MKKLFDKDAAKRFWNNIKKLFVRKPQNEGAAGKYLKYVSEDSTEWADFPAFLNYKGIKDTYDDLPKSGNVKGDVYTVKDSNAEYFWDQDETWNYIGRLVDMNGYVPLEGDSTITGYIRINGGLVVDADDGPTLTIGTNQGSVKGNFAISDSLIVGEYNIIASGAHHSSVIGEKCKTNGENTVAAGYYVNTPNKRGAFACGYYNSTVNSPIFSVGNGVDNEDLQRHNALEVFEDSISLNQNTTISGSLAADDGNFSGTIKFSKLDGSIPDKNKLILLPENIEEGGYYRYDISTTDTTIKLPSLDSSCYSKTIFLIINNNHSANKSASVKITDSSDNQLGSFSFGLISTAYGIKGKKVIIENILGHAIYSEEDIDIKVNTQVAQPSSSDDGQ